MKIACISTSIIPATTANSIQVMKVCQALAQEGNTVRLYTPGKTISAWDDLAARYGLQTPFEVCWLPSLQALKRYDFAFAALRKARGWGADLIYTWTPQAATPAARQGYPVVLEVHDRPMGRLGPALFRGFLRQPGRKRLLVITRALQGILERQFGSELDEGIVRLAPNGVELERYTSLPDAPTARGQLGLPERTTAVYTGHFYAGRGMGLLADLAKAFPQVGFLWVGGRPDDGKNWQARLDADAVHNVTLTGFVDNRCLPLYQAAGDFLLMPYERAITGSSGGNSAEFCSPMKMFDYLASGRVILASDLPVIHEVLNEENAVLCPPENLPAWQAALAALLADPERCQRLGRKARRDAARYTWRERAQRALEGMEP